ncbi:DNA glycosylase [Syncephalis pseudoplumigaleata]|uniref:Endonuclease III homolog n=1 Tax=Syncephalis pseudoplumigaleata TaxID=1712513 RepID=A0A4P9Z081_9FUNG|nr:DNA glycosylase [Syncephalis pseudoplumigaleata]|eukprot:RKP24740.1 DNA glycosylase [Syncephalis pseudoplumigaleata]
MPPNWTVVYNAIRAYRAQTIAPVDVVGCHILGDRCRGPKTFRFQTLVALMLSAQTKDQTTGQAMHRLRDGFTAWTLATASVADIDRCIEKVGFHSRKARFIQEVAGICVAKYQGDIPDSLQGLLDLPGVGPKMSFLALQAAWGKNIGIGVDTHVHRISNRLGWVRTKQPEETRRVLETFVPREYWAAINPMLVGFGQTTCLPVAPRCPQCPVRDLCPSSTVLSKKARKQ